MSEIITGKLPNQLEIYDAANDGAIIAMVVQVTDGRVMYTTPNNVNGSGGESVQLDRVEIGFVNRSTTGWLDIGEPMPTNVEDFEVEVNGVDRNTQNVVEVDQVGQRIRVEDTDPLIAKLQKVTFTKLV